MEKIIFDTDIGGDCDDTGSLAIVHECERAGKAKLLYIKNGIKEDGMEQKFH